jgi:hypothetical protein
VDDARVAIYNFIIDIIKENIPNLHPVVSQLNAWEMWNRSRDEQLHQTTSSDIDDNQPDPHAPDDTPSRHVGARWGQLNRDDHDLHDDGDDAEITTPRRTLPPFWIFSL